MGSYGQAIVAFSDWIHATAWRQVYFDFVDEFATFFEEVTERSFADYLGRLDDDRTQVLTTQFLESFLAASIDGGILDDFRTSGQTDLDQGQVAYLRALWSSTPSIYEISEAAPGSHLILKDALRGGAPVRVRERSASAVLAKSDLLLTRVISVKGVSQMSGGSVTIPREGLPFLTAENARQKKALSKSLAGAKGEVDDLILNGAANTVNLYALATWLVASAPQSR